MSKKYKTILEGEGNDQADQGETTAAPSVASAVADNDNQQQRGAPSPRTQASAPAANIGNTNSFSSSSSSVGAPSSNNNSNSSRPASRAADNETVAAMATSISQSLMNTLKEGQQQMANLQLSLSNPFGGAPSGAPSSGNGGGNGGEGNDQQQPGGSGSNASSGSGEGNGSSHSGAGREGQNAEEGGIPQAASASSLPILSVPPLSALQQPRLDESKGESKESERGNADEPNKGGKPDESATAISTDTTRSKAIGLTRAYSTPETSRSPTRYHPSWLKVHEEGVCDDNLLGGLDHSSSASGRGLDHLSSSATGDQSSLATGENDGEQERDLKQTYPLLLQRSASSAFGSPSCKFNRAHAKRTHSNSGSSDPGASAFHPVWSCKSLSSGGSISGSQVGSDIGSTISSSVAVSSTGCSTGHASLANTSHRSVHSDPSGKKKSYNSPWRRVVARMKKSNRKGGGGSRDSGSGDNGLESFRKHISGRENPARPNLSEDELPFVVVPATTVASSEVSLEGSEVVKSTEGGGETKAAKRGNGSSVEGGSSTASSKTRKMSSREKKKAARKTKAAAASKKKKKKSDKDVKKDSVSSKDNTEERQYDDPGVALDLSDSDNDDDDTIEGHCIPLDESDRVLNQQQSTTSNKPNKPSSTIEDIVPPSQLMVSRPTAEKKAEQQQQQQQRPSPSIEIPCDSVEVVTTSVTPGSETVQIFSPANLSIDEENSPPAVERVTVVVEEGERGENFPYHPLGSERQQGQDGEDANVDANITNQDARRVSGDTAMATLASVIPSRLKYRSPQRTTSSQPSSMSSSNRGHDAGTTGSGSSQQHGSPTSSSQNSPDSRLSLPSGGSPSSRISSSNSRMSATVSTLNSGGDRTINTLHSAEGSLLVVDGMDYEVREANRRSLRDRRIGSGVSGEMSNQEVAVGLDGNDTVFSSSTTSSNYHAYLSSPRPLRDGATLPVERFFAGGNVTMSPSPQKGSGGTIVVQQSDHPASSTPGPSISKLLSPRKPSRIGAGGTSGSTTRDATHSPHTVSSNSVSLANSSSSGSSETKKPLKFVAYEIREEERESPFDEPPVSRYAAVGGGMGALGGGGGGGVRDTTTTTTVSSLIKPRISKVGGTQSQRRPPMVHRTSPPKPPQSPRNSAISYGRARTPTRTPPPSSYNISSGANTPCSPPVIIDGPVGSANVASLGDSSLRPTRPYVVRRSSAAAGAGAGSRGMFLIPPRPAPSYRPQPRQQQHPTIPSQPTTSVALAAAMTSRMQDNLTGVGTTTGANAGAHEIIFAAADDATSTAVVGGGDSTTTNTVSPERLTMQTARRLHTTSPIPELKEKPSGQGDAVAVVSPEKGF